MGDVIYTQYRESPWSTVFDPLLNVLSDKADKRSAIEDREDRQKEARDVAQADRDFVEKASKQRQAHDMAKEMFNNIGDYPSAFQPMAFQQIQTLLKFSFDDKKLETGVLFEPGAKWDSSLSKIKEGQVKTKAELFNAQATETVRQIERNKKLEKEDRNLGVRKAEGDIDLTKARTEVLGQKSSGPVDKTPIGTFKKEADAQRELDFRGEMGGLTIDDYVLRFEDKDGVFQESAVEELNANELKEYNHLNKKYALNFPSFEREKGFFYGTNLVNTGRLGGSAPTDIRSAFRGL